MVQEVAHRRGECNLSWTANGFGWDDFDGAYRYGGWQCSDPIYNIERWARIDGFLIPNVRNSKYEHFI